MGGCPYVRARAGRLKTVGLLQKLHHRQRKTLEVVFAIKRGDRRMPTFRLGPYRVPLEGNSCLVLAVTGMPRRPPVNRCSPDDSRCGVRADDVHQEPRSAPDLSGDNAAAP